MTQKNYLSDWEAFVNYIVLKYEQGVSDIAISQELSGSKVSWIGQIVDIKLDEKYSPGIALCMEPKFSKLSKGKTLRSDYLFLNIDGKTKLSWHDSKIGEVVKFTAIIAKTPGPFPEIQLSVDEYDSEVLLMIGVYNSELVAKVT